MELSVLADHPEAVDVVATWYFDEWGHETPGLTLEQVKKQVSASVNRASAPMLVLATKQGQAIGAAELKIREMDIYPDKEFWLGGVYVVKVERGKGAASALVEEVLSRARSAGINHLYLQTEQLADGLYAKLGFKPLEEVCYKGHQVLVMVARTGDKGA